MNILFLDITSYSAETDGTDRAEGSESKIKCFLFVYFSRFSRQKAKIDVWGVGTKLITAYDQPALGAVYKIVSIEDDQGVMHDTIKLSNNAEKVSTPGKKQVWRITSRAKGGFRRRWMSGDLVQIRYR